MSLSLKYKKVVMAGSLICNYCHFRNSDSRLSKSFSLLPFCPEAFVLTCLILFLLWCFKVWVSLFWPFFYKLHVSCFRSSCSSGAHALFSWQPQRSGIRCFLVGAFLLLQTHVLCSLSTQIIRISAE